MSNSEKRGKKAITVAIYMLLVTWILLLLLLIAVYALRLQGYNSFYEWKNRNQTETVRPLVVTPAPVAVAGTDKAEGTENIPVTQRPEQTGMAEESFDSGESREPENVSEKTPEKTPEKENVPEQVTALALTGQETIDEEIRYQAAKFFGEEAPVYYISYETGIYFSVVFQQGEKLLPLVYNRETQQQMTGSKMMKETYFAIIKERLQTEVRQRFPEEAGSSFVTYEELYQVEDYEQFYMTEDSLVFYFDENTLTENSHAPFCYEVELSEAEAFFYNKLDGSPNGHAIRELDPEAKMIALTFDDGPYSKIEEKLIPLLESYDAKATFFFLGHRAEEWYPEMPGKLYAAGHEVASHTYSHELNFDVVSAEELWTEVNRTNLVLAKACGYAPEYIRFPGGSAGKTGKVPMLVVNWDMDSVDYADKNTENGDRIIFERLLNSSYFDDGSIVLLHSIYENSYGAVELLLPYLKEQGYELVTLSELFYYKCRDKELEPGVVYFDGQGNTKRVKRQE